MSRYLSYFLFAFIILGVSCGKSNPENALPVQQFFETNILNTDYVVSLAQDSSGNITFEYNSYVFRLLKTDFYHGPLQVTIGTTVYLGTWVCDSDYGMLTISLPDSPTVFQFLNRSWRFVKKGIPTFQLSPWGTTQPYALNMTKK